VATSGDQHKRVPDGILKSQIVPRMKDGTDCVQDSAAEDKESRFQIDYGKKRFPCNDNYPSERKV